MLKEAIEKIYDLAEGKLKRTTEEINGKKYSFVNLFPVLEPMPEPFIVATLSGLIDYLKGNAKDNTDCEGYNVFVLINSPTKVSIISSLIGDFEQRATLVIANAFPCKFQFNHFYEHESFMISFQAWFNDTPGKADVLKLVGNLQTGTIRTVADDGISQKATVRSGITRVEETTVPGIVALQPFRTFKEIKQPESSYILRLRENANGLPEVGIFDAGGDHWQFEAMCEIKAYLDKELKDTGITVLG